MGAEDLRAAFSVARKLAAALDSSTGALLTARSVRAQLDDLKPRATGTLAVHRESLDTQIATVLKPPEETHADQRGLELLNTDIATLYAQVERVDAAPTQVQVTETERAIADWHLIEGRWKQLRDVAMPAFNTELSTAHLPRLRTDLAPPRNADLADQE